MKTCKECHVHVQTEDPFCPLCGTPLEETAPPDAPVPRNLYPDLRGAMRHYNFFRRLLIFLSLLAGILSVPVNLLTSPRPLWCLIVIAAIAYCWLTIPPMLRRGVNFAAQTVLQVTLTGALVVALDAILGWRGWSTSYAVPGLLSAGTLAIVLMAVFNRTNWPQYVLYQVLLGIFGFIPLALYFLGAAHNLVMVLVSTGIALASLLATFVFGDRSIKSEFKRRFHF